MESFVVSQQYQQRYGIRRLLVLSGRSDWCGAQAQRLSSLLPGDWLWISASTPKGVTALSASNVRGVLGREFLHAVFDARDGLDAQALAILAGALKAGSWLILLSPQWNHWPDYPDTDSLRWSEQPEPIATPRFIRHVQRQLMADDDVVLWRQQDAEPVIMPPGCRPDWLPATGEPTFSQHTVVQQLLHTTCAVSVIIAPRGRGKSTLAGMLASQCQGGCWVSAPSRAAGEILLRQAGEAATFWAPDALLAFCQQHDTLPVDWLLIDEAAAIPAPILQALLPFFRRLVMTTTVQGYEGTGRGFLLKFCASLPDWRAIELTEPLRWAQQDPLEKIVDRMMLFDAEKQVPERLCGVSFEIRHEQRDDWLSQPERLEGCYGLLCSAHYRTSPLDLRRLLDAPGMYVASACVDARVGGVIWLVDEGGLPETLAQDVWAGRRRPRGNLVAQSLAAHGNQWRAPVLRSRRISRIAVLALHRGQGIGQALVRDQQQQARQERLDFLSVSFGFQPELWRFWQRCGFQLVRIGSHMEASSGCYSAMALLPLSDEGSALAVSAHRELLRDWFWLRHNIPLALDLPLVAEQVLTGDDWRNLAGFALAHRPPEACQGALSRLIMHSPMALTALRLWLEQGQSMAECVLQLQLAGKKALLQRWRTETAQALRQIDDAAWQHWHDILLP
ncbi:tRNA(Met) cytidine acetyltransferase TmcA [Dickeya poaceiphila]|uniref:tRNA(Met) cytidine acetyltransferase TmcA n=1 Tax=Dickeya poaceiphila TaxID=568768 RepID=A0A5B8I8I8_9GAMM|nr:GNAT family N-acetyltransferase [Dickeya poaceiphila]QDX30704.1 tRNA(Met) cytidine acetyltransferase [Dickeya poaceiphila]